MSNHSEFEQVVELVFQNVQYLLTVSLAPGDTLCVEAEHKTDGSRWRGDFTARYIEEITQKTGNFKKFSVFVKMLRSAILQESDSVFVDLLTYQDFEMLKNRKMRDIGTQALRSATNNKRYLILTYTGEFDRVHYPLPLLHEDNPEPEALKRTIRRLRDELEDVKAQLQKRIEQNRHGFLDDDESVRKDPDRPEIQKLREENSLLTAQLTCMEDSYRMFGFGTQIDRREDDGERKKLQKELALTQKKCDLLFSRIEAKKDTKKETEMLRARLDQLQVDLRSERSVHRKALARLARDNTTLTDQVRTLRDAEKKLRVKVRESESELDILKRRLKIQGSRDLPPSRTRPREAFSVGPSTRMGGGIPSGLRRPSPLSTRTNTPTAKRRRTPPGSRPSSRPSSCPSFSNSRNQSREEVVSVIRGRSPGQQRPIRSPYSRPVSSARSEDAYSRETSRSIGRSTRPVQSSSARTASPVETHTTSKSGRSKASRERESQRYARENVSPSPVWSRDTGFQPLRGVTKGTGTASTPGCFTTDDEREPVVERLSSRLGSRASSPGTVLRDVKAKLHKYARIEGYDISDTESRGTSGSFKDFNGDSSSMDRSGRFDVMIERPYDDDKEVRDIDSRLHALKNFLRTAKARTAQSKTSR
ncbi:hypothetical protein M758_1G039700 [Ceratodon purpureus]|uniref:Coiled-coil domain-containing protein 61 n=1 Tax=Ceratodon purpureus TaxID=3225 RepID=A0A8T0J3C0_CERPU|nr:hypothetical protein KC19_1G041700 [Ceratodon purpureus]KAG0628615.1 hypothetical protein M758_1G039700 [Ceratodon purpureus]